MNNTSADLDIQQSRSVPLPLEDELREVLGTSYNPNTLSGVKMLAGSRDCFKATVGLVKALCQADGVEPKQREMITPRAAKLLKAPYESQANSQMALNVGLTATQIKAAAGQGPLRGVGADYILVCRATDELTHKCTLVDLTLSKLLERFAETTLVSSCSTGARFLSKPPTRSEKRQAQ